jgi:hypothetical protein
MFKKDILFRKKGIATILGTLIFVGIVFSAYIPMVLMMKQADIIYEQEIYQTKIRDQLREDEELIITAFGNYTKSGNESDKNRIYVYAHNTGTDTVEVARVWINDGNYEVSQVVDVSESVELGDWILNGTDGDEALIKVTTKNGNVFVCYMGELIFDPTKGWYTFSMGITITILNDAGQFQICVRNYDTMIKVDEYNSSGTEHDDIIHTVVVDVADNYYVDVLKKISGSYQSLNGVPVEVDVPSKIGNPIVYLYVDGR